MNLTIHQCFLPHTDFDASIAFYRDALGFELRNDVEYGGVHWATLGPPNQPDVSVVLTPPAGGDPGVTPEELSVVREMMAKGTYAGINLATPNVDAAFASLESALPDGADVVQEPTDQPWGIRDCALRDPDGNMIRIFEVR
ncbi:VOC family protein [Demetria terragena]|uniref:VOC family protein n=1 Tax=Demetria terragena TaxID=63959 RepID=UPI0003725434|nr:VOC family protein [Demetria terragena]